MKILLRSLALFTHDVIFKELAYRSSIRRCSSIFPLRLLVVSKIREFAKILRISAHIKLYIKINMFNSISRNPEILENLDNFDVIIKNNRRNTK